MDSCQNPVLLGADRTSQDRGPNSCLIIVLYTTCKTYIHCSNSLGRIPLCCNQQTTQKKRLITQMFWFNWPRIKAAMKEVYCLSYCQDHLREPTGSSGTHGTWLGNWQSHLPEKALERQSPKDYTSSGPHIAKSTKFSQQKERGCNSSYLEVYRCNDPRVVSSCL